MQDKVIMSCLENNKFGDDTVFICCLHLFYFEYSTRTEVLSVLPVKCVRVCACMRVFVRVCVGGWGLEHDFVCDIETKP